MKGEFKFGEGERCHWKSNKSSGMSGTERDSCIQSNDGGNVILIVTPTHATYRASRSNAAIFQAGRDERTSRGNKVAQLIAAASADVVGVGWVQSLVIFESESERTRRRRHLENFEAASYALPSHSPGASPSLSSKLQRHGRWHQDIS